MGESVVSDGTPAERAEHLVADEVIAAIESLSAAEKLRLLDIEKVYLRGTGFSPKELLHDAMCRAIVGGRKCPREVAFVAFLAQTMRGIAYHERKKRRREPPLPSAPRSEGKDDGAQVEVAADQLNPEEHLIEQEPDNSVAIIDGHFVDDEQARLVLLGWAGDLRGKELREFVGVDQAGLDYIIKRIRRVMKKKYPNGWTT